MKIAKCPKCRKKSGFLAFKNVQRGNKKYPYVCHYDKKKYEQQRASSWPRSIRSWTNRNSPREPSPRPVENQPIFSNSTLRSVIPVQVVLVIRAGIALLELGNSQLGLIQKQVTSLHQGHPLFINLGGLSPFRDRPSRQPRRP